VTFTAGVGSASITLADAQSTTLTAAKGTITGTSTSFTVAVGATSNFTVPTPATQTAGTAFNVTLTATDADGNTTTGYTGFKAMTFADPDTAPNGTNPTFPGFVNFSAGVGTASITLVDAESTTLTANQGAVSGTSNNFTIKAGVQASLYLVVTSQPNPAVTCTGPATNLTTCSSTNQSNSASTLVSKLQLVDTFGNTVTNTGGTVTVNLATSGSGSVTPSPLTIVNGASTSSGSLTLNRSGGFFRTVNMTAKVGTTTELTVTMSS
jgi:hypothetical protein